MLNFFNVILNSSFLKDFIICVISGLVSYRIAKYQTDKSREISIKIEAKFRISNLKLDFLKECIDILSNHEQSLSSILAEYSTLISSEGKKLASSENLAEKIVEHFDISEKCFRKFLINYQAKRYIMNEDVSNYNLLESTVVNINENYQLLLKKIGISRLFLEKNLKTFDQKELTTNRLKLISENSEADIANYLEIVRNCLSIFQILAKSEIQNLQNDF